MPTTAAAPPPAQPPAPSSPPAVAVRAVRAVRRYGSGDAAVVALAGVDVAFASGRLTAVMGPSGSGKSTLLHCLAGLDRLDSGSVLLGDTDLAALDDAGLTRLRRDRLGFVFQSFNLVPTLSARENIVLPSRLAGRPVDAEQLAAVVAVVGLADRLEHRPDQLSGGQQQRVACARALLSRPELVLADEPTGNLDSRSGAEVLGFLRRSSEEFAQTTVMVTHDPTAASYAHRAVFLADGRVVDDLDAPTPARVLAATSRLER